MKRILRSLHARETASAMPARLNGPISAKGIAARDRLSDDARKNSKSRWFGASYDDQERAIFRRAREMKAVGSAAISLPVSRHQKADTSVSRRRLPSIASG